MQNAIAVNIEGGNTPYEDESPKTHTSVDILSLLKEMFVVGVGLNDPNTALIPEQYLTVAEIRGQGSGGIRRVGMHHDPTASQVVDLHVIHLPERAPFGAVDTAQ